MCNDKQCRAFKEANGIGTNSCIHDTSSSYNYELGSGQSQSNYSSNIMRNYN